MLLYIDFHVRAFAVVLLMLYFCYPMLLDDTQVAPMRINEVTIIIIIIIIRDADEKWCCNI